MADTDVSTIRPPMQLGLVLHPHRNLDGPLRAIRDWAAKHGVSVGQIAIPGKPLRMGDPVEVGTATFADPRAPARVLQELEAWAHRTNRTSIHANVGAAHGRETTS